MGGQPALASEGRFRVLNVHAEAVVLASRTMALNDAGYEVAEALDARSALAQALGRPDLILLDLHLPHLHAFELLVRLKDSAATRGIPVLATARAGSGGAAVNARAAGAESVVAGPPDPSRLRAEVAALLGRRRRVPAGRAV